MNIQRFSAPTSREALAKARKQFGEAAVILSTRQTGEGFEVMATSEESLSNLVPPAQAPVAVRASDREIAKPPRKPSLAERDPMPRPAVNDTVDGDTQTMAMSTLSFQDYVRERMLRKRRESLQAEPESTAREAAPGEPQAPRTVSRPEPVKAPVQVPVQRFNEPAFSIPAALQMPQPIRTRPVVRQQWDEPQPLAAADPVSAPSDQRVAVELAALKDMIEERFNTLAWLGSSKQNPVQSGLMLKLIRAGYSPAMSRAVLERLPDSIGAAEAMRWIMDVLARNLRTAPAGAGLADEGGVIALVGATGVGKTTTAAKLAAQCVRTHGTASVGLITLDTYRVSGYEQLRAYGRMLGVVAHLAHDRAALKDLLALLANKRMVIIDTAGLGQRDQRIQDMLDMLEMPQVKKTLVLNAGSHGDTLDEVLTSFKASTLHGVVLSKVDEAVKLGPALDALIRHQVVLRGVANGQRVPEDWQNPDAASLVRVSMGTRGKSSYDPVQADMGLYFGQSSARGITLGGAHV
jgi:flagellar biosynthesis protein FlhF